MSKLKPVGSEKLQGIDKLQRIMEIARYKETLPNSINETSSVDYRITMADGHTYEIVKERLGYIIKKQVNESTSEYIDPIKNRKHFSSYSAAMKKLNLMAGEINRVNGISEGISLFTEDKKYMLKTPQPKAEEPTEMTPPSPEPSPAPAPTEEIPAPSAETEELPMSPEGEEMSSEDETLDIEDTEDMGEMGDEEDEGVSFKSIQKLTGKLAQKVRDYKDKDGEITSKDSKYVINSILSALIDDLDDEDKDDIISKLEGEEESEFDSEEIDVEDTDTETDTETDVETEEIPLEEPESEMEEEYMGEMEFKETDFVTSALDSIFKESTIEKVLKKYVVVNENEKKFITEKKQNEKLVTEEKKQRYFSEIKRLSESLSQAKIAKKIVENFPNISFVGKTNKGNLVFENKNKQLKVSPKGNIL